MTVVPPPNYFELKSTVTGIIVYAPIKETAPQSDVEVEFKCPRCGAATAYNVVDGMLTCSHCDYSASPVADKVGRLAEESEFSLENLERSVYGWGGDNKEITCQSCGAQTITPPERISVTCPFCGSNKVVQSSARPDLLRPKFLIPFKVEEQACQSLVRTWLGGSWMTPDSVKKIGNPGEFSAIYLPYWTFHATTEAAWKAEVGHTVTERYYDAGVKEWKTRTRIDWRWESGSVRLDHDDLLVPGTDRVSNHHLGKVQDFDLNGLVNYDVHFLAGFLAQAYDRILESAWEMGRQQMRELTRQACVDQASTSIVRNFRMELDFSDESWRYLLLPVYLSVYRHEGKVFQVVVNGQTGAVSGQRPVDWQRVWLVISLLLAPGILGGLVGLITLPLAGAGMVIGGIGFILLVVGVIISLVIFNKANLEGAA